MIRVGPAGWSYADWNGRVYPRRRERGFHPLAYLARYFACIELNGTFYGMPTAEHASTWARLVAPHPEFRFTAKLHQSFTHGPPLAADEHAATLTRFRDGLQPLVDAGRLAALLAQFPHGFQPDEDAFRCLERIQRDFAPLPIVLELRHRSWHASEVVRRVAALGVSLARIDLPGSGPNDPAFGPVGYLRLHGRNAPAWYDREAGRDQRYDYLYSPDELRGLVAVARRLATGVDETFVITNNHFSGKAVANALEILAGLADPGTISAPAPLAPLDLVEAFPHLRGQVRIDGQNTLF